MPSLRTRTARAASPRPSAPLWRPSGLLTLTTDYGLADPYVGIVKGVLRATAGSVTAIDLTHAVPPQDVRSAAFFLAHSWRYFPPGTVHLAIVDPGVGSRRRILVARDRGHAFLAPDNGLLGPVLSSSARVVALDVERFSLPGRSRTFHGRDVFAPAAARIAAGLAPERAGRRVADWLRLRFPLPKRARGGTITGEVLLADHFGNLITNVPAAVLAGRASERARASGWSAHAGGARFPVRETYADAEVGELLALVDSYGFLELAVRGGNAAARLQLAPGAPVVFERRSRGKA
jgi:S-adenosyl-L-methionine hydrolase (adenosine-forming)